MSIYVELQPNQTIQSETEQERSGHLQGDTYEVMSTKVHAKRKSYLLPLFVYSRPEAHSTRQPRFTNCREINQKTINMSTVNIEGVKSNVPF